MILHNSYYYYQQALTSSACEDIIAYGLQKIYKEKRSGYDVNAQTHGNKEKNDEIKKPLSDLTYEELKNKNLNNKDFYIRDSEVTWLKDQWIYDLLTPIIKKANSEAGWNFQLTTAEDIQFTVYKPGGFYGWHYDGESDKHSAYKRYFEGITPIEKKGNALPPHYVKNNNFLGLVRKISMTCNLNKPGEYEGGNLKFDFGPHIETGDRYKVCEEIRPQGSVIAFPSFLYHCVTPITKGERYSLVMWSLGRPFV